MGNSKQARTDEDVKLWKTLRKTSLRKFSFHNLE